MPHRQIELIQHTDTETLNRILIYGTSGTGFVYSKFTDMAGNVPMADWIALAAVLLGACKVAWDITKFFIQRRDKARE